MAGAAGGTRHAPTGFGWRIVAAKARLIRPGETMYVILSLLLASLTAAHPASPARGYLEILMDYRGWVALFTVAGVLQLAALLRGELRDRLAAAVLNVPLWGLTGVVFVVAVPGGSLLGPTMLVLAAGSAVTSASLLRTLAGWQKLNGV